MPHPSTSTGMPPSDVTQSTSSSASPFAARRAAATSLRTPVDVSACTTAMTRRARVRVEQRCGSIGWPHGRRPARPRRRTAPATSHMRSPNTPLTPMTTDVAGLDHVDEAASMPAEPVPLIGSVSALVGAEHLRAAGRRSRRAARGSRDRGGRARAGEGRDHLGIRVARAGAHRAPDRDGIAAASLRPDSSGPLRATRRSAGSATRPSRMSASDTRHSSKPKLAHDRHEDAAARRRSRRPAPPRGRGCGCARRSGSVASVRNTSSAAALREHEVVDAVAVVVGQAELDRGHRRHRAGQADERRAPSTISGMARRTSSR